MEKKYLLVHTWLDTAESEQKRRQVWKSQAKTLDNYELAHSTMKYEFMDYMSDNKTSVIAACLGCESAYMEYADGNREIWTISQED